ncbi:hypothetical protein DVH24_021654 [Malus domestica]|uniref:Uncharacterized protein n=1 Tax=Malus domestica TaxID=3750 RepID=A0A498K288_MALDO|nr:hypothetical protein DVH24_021654 [Malus domestica]
MLLAIWSERAGTINVFLSNRSVMDSGCKARARIASKSRFGWLNWSGTILDLLEGYMSKLSARALGRLGWRGLGSSVWAAHVQVKLLGSAPADYMCHKPHALGFPRVKWRLPRSPLQRRQLLLAWPQCLVMAKVQSLSW